MIDKTTYRYQKAFLKSEIRRLFDRPFNVDALHHSLCSHMMSEVQELMDCRSWMLHKKPPNSTRYNTITEMVDVYKWLLNVMILHDVTPEEFKTVFIQKSRVVEDRIKTEVFVRSGPGPCLVCDIDGVICDRDTVLLDFVNSKSGTSFQSIRDLKATLSAKEYALCKKNFYESDSFEKCPPMESSIRALRSLAGSVPIVLLTARNVKRDANLHFHTLRWLEAHKVPYSALLFDEEKDRALHWASPSSIGIDDDPEQVERMNRVIEARLFKDHITIEVAGDEIIRLRRHLGCQSPTTNSWSLSIGWSNMSMVRSWPEIDPAESRLPPGES